MSQLPISRSPDLLRLRDEGFELEIRSSHLLVTSIPYLNASKAVRYGTLVCPITLAGNIAQAPGDHVACFSSDETPCDENGVAFKQIIESTTQKLAGDVEINFRFSSKPPEGAYANFYDKITTYSSILERPAQTIEEVSARTFRPVVPEEAESVFNYLDTASSRAGIMALTEKLRTARVAIVGLGGTGSYVLDLLVKCPIGELHIFDGDKFLSHNAFRSPGAPSLEELEELPTKVAYFFARYSKMHRHIVTHENRVTADSLNELEAMDFIFLCLDSGEDKRVIVKQLEEWGKPFIDVGMGVEWAEDSLLAILRVTTSTEGNRSHVWDQQRIPFANGEGNNEYSKNIQIADLNALNAAMAVIKWKKICGFYLDLENEYYSDFVTSGNVTNNDHQASLL